MGSREQVEGRSESEVRGQLGWGLPRRALGSHRPSLGGRVNWNLFALATLVHEKLRKSAGPGTV